MNESFQLPSDQSNEETKEGHNERLRAEIIELAIELEKSQEVFPFPGIEQSAYEELKASDEAYPGYTTPTDEIISRMKSVGIDIDLGDHPESGNVFILPADSVNIAQDSLAPRHLMIDNIEDARLKRLVELDRSWKK